MTLAQRCWVPVQSRSQRGAVAVRWHACRLSWQGTEIKQLDLSRCGTLIGTAMGGMTSFANAVEALDTAGEPCLSGDHACAHARARMPGSGPRPGTRLTRFTMQRHAAIIIPCHGCAGVRGTTSLQSPTPRMWTCPNGEARQAAHLTCAGRRMRSHAGALRARTHAHMHACTQGTGG